MAEETTCGTKLRSTVAAIACLASLSSAAAAGLEVINPLGSCQGNCAGTIYAGRFLDTSMKSVFGLKDFVAPPRWRWGDSGFVGAALSRPVLRYDDLFQVEIEAGAGKRFGDLTSPELWAAVYFRWVWFPWNHIVRTSVAVSTGLNVALHRDAIEDMRMNNGGRGSRLMHHLSPEITFGLPSAPHVDLVLRLHHRSGGRDVFGPLSIFNGAEGGAQYGVIGVRARF